LTGRPPPHRYETQDNIYTWPLSELGGLFHSTCVMHSSAEPGRFIGALAATNPFWNFDHCALGMCSAGLEEH
jgi:hypothetical protein